MKLNENLRFLRKEKNLSQQEMGSNLSIERYVISNWEQGRSEPSVQDLTGLADFFDVTLDELLGRDELGRKPASSAPNLSKDEMRVLELFNKLGVYEREAILIQLEALADRQPAIKR